MLDSHDNFKDATLKSMPNREVCLIGNLRQSYLDLIDMLPPENYAEILINNYFTEYNWHYTILDRNVFTDHLEEFYLELAAIRSFGKVSFSLDTLYFPALMLELLAVSLKFLPSSYDRRLDSLLNGRSASEWSTDYNNSSAEIQECLGRYNASFISVQASFLRVVWLKVNSQVTESWRALGGVIKESEDMGLHQEGGTREFSNAEDACGHAWSEEIRRRFMLNLFLWDRYGFMCPMKVCILTIFVVEWQQCLVNPPISNSRLLVHCPQIPLYLETGKHPFRFREKTLRGQIPSRCGLWSMLFKNTYLKSGSLKKMVLTRKTMR